jgi:HEAT repeat protein
MLMPGDNKVIQEHISNLADKDKLVREHSAYMLGEIAAEMNSIKANTLKDDAQLEQMNAMHNSHTQEKVVVALIDALTDSEPWVRGNAVEALGKLGDISCLPSLINALQDSDRIVRATSAEALGSFRDTRSIEGLKSALFDDEWSVRLNAIKSLGRVGDQTVIDALKTMKSDSNHDVKVKLREAIQTIHHNEALTDKPASLSAVSSNKGKQT